METLFFPYTVALSLSLSLSHPSVGVEMEASGGTFSDRTKSSHFSHPALLSYPIHNKRSCALSYSNTTHTHT